MARCSGAVQFSADTKPTWPLFTDGPCEFALRLDPLVQFSTVWCARLAVYSESQCTGRSRHCGCETKLCAVLDGSRSQWQAQGIHGSVLPKTCGLPGTPALCLNLSATPADKTQGVQFSSRFRPLHSPQFMLSRMCPADHRPQFSFNIMHAPYEPHSGAGYLRFSAPV